jgi:perosamine synthetase
MAGKFIPVYEPYITQQEIDYVVNAIKSGWVSSLGDYLSQFESKFAQYVGTQYALTVVNGTSALHLALVSLGIKANDEVIIPNLTFIATANAVAYTNAKPIPVDVEPDTWCIAPEALERAITSKTKAIVPVHLYGHPANMDVINELANINDLYVIEDAAEAHCAEYKGKKVGSLGHCGIFSFYGNKIMTTGEGGMLTTNDKELYEKAKFLRDHAMSREKRYWHTEVGYNYRMTNLQAAFGYAQLEKIDYILDKKRQIFQWYNECLGNIQQLELNPEKEWAKNVYWMVCIILSGDLKLTRDELIINLRKKGIDSRPFFYPVSDMPMYKLNNSFPHPTTRILSENGINLPSSINLAKEDVIWISDTLLTLLEL